MWEFECKVAVVLMGLTHCWTSTDIMTSGDSWLPNAVSATTWIAFALSHCWWCNSAVSWRRCRNVRYVPTTVTRCWWMLASVLQCAVVEGRKVLSSFSPLVHLFNTRSFTFFMILLLSPKIELWWWCDVCVCNWYLHARWLGIVCLKIIDTSLLIVLVPIWLYWHW